MTPVPKGLSDLDALNWLVWTIVSRSKQLEMHSERGQFDLVQKIWKELQEYEDQYFKIWRKLKKEKDSA